MHDDGNHHRPAAALVKQIARRIRAEWAPSHRERHAVDTLAPGALTPPRRAPPGKSKGRCRFFHNRPRFRRIFKTMGSLLRGTRMGPLLGGVLAAIAFAGDARAVIEQTDGTVVPVSTGTCPGAPNSCIQTALNIGEGFLDTATTNPLKAIFDATVTPEVFAIPKVNGNFGLVKVDDLQEGAGYENTFGWYNVSDPGSLYPITPCADEPFDPTRVVNFQTEFTAGRYKGGFIGFFLATPENQPTSDNCGALGNIGHLYYTEQARNGDGNYVHYLVYQSKAVALTYYFGFEDLFRGGDNDFDDMVLKVNGLLAPCVPSPEICDGKDNNCDGLVDNSPVDAGGTCGGSSVGACKPGTNVCVNGGIVCVGAVGPTPEICNGIDDDCNGIIDDGPVGVGQSCGTNVGECKFGANSCIGGVLVCVGGKGPSLEICNSKDDDCNGAVDNTTIDTGGACGSNIGACKPGTQTCVSGMIVCIGGTLGTPEVCNNLDDDCNGAIDDGDPGGGTTCGTDVGACSSGVQHCQGGVLVCVGAVGPTAELCDGIDNNCDGIGDNLAVCPNGSQCVAGSCAGACKSGEFQCPGGQVCVTGFCVPQSCDNVSCPAGKVCVQGSCVKDPDAGTPDGGSTGEGGGSSAGGGAPSGATGSGSGSNTTSSSGTAGAGGDDGSKSIWGLATGGGGLRCSTEGGSRGGDPWAYGALGLLGLALLRRRNGGAS
jgi:MYXO-CTERM domain-containing protein